MAASAACSAMSPPKTDVGARREGRGGGDKEVGKSPISSGLSPPRAEDTGDHAAVMVPLPSAGWPASPVSVDAPALARVLRLVVSASHGAAITVDIAVSLTLLFGATG